VVTLDLRVRPVIKWAGGKRQMLGQYAPYFPLDYRAYHEPFLGGGAVYFFLSPAKAFLSDINEELINMYRVLQTSVRELINDLHSHLNDREYYYNLRAMDPAGLNEVQRASRLIFLNKTCYNGLYRVNRKNQFNVPFGSYAKPKIVDEEVLLAAHFALQGATLERKDFQVVLDRSRSGDFVYFDPPYVPLSRTANFTDYTNGSFDSREQARLADTFHELTQKGCLVMLSNSDTPLIRDLYGKYLKGFVVVQGVRCVNSRGDRRGRIDELLICNWLK